MAKTLSFINQINISYFLISYLKKINGQLDNDIKKKQKINRLITYK